MTTSASTDRLARYRAKRDFDRTSEPSGRSRVPSGAPSAPPDGTLRFVVQRHRAGRLHYDLRLEMSGVLASWAVPKGPTLDPKARHLAVHVEDHPLDYFDFEGVIPRGEYGGGDVIVWDWGTWQLGKGDDPQQAVDDGDLHFDLNGEKLRGRFVLTRREDSQWLLLHKNDEYAEPGWDPEEWPRSVKSGHTNSEIALAPPATWNSDASSDAAERRLAGPARDEWQGADDKQLDTLAGMTGDGQWSIGGRRVRLSNLDKTLFPGARATDPLTKRDVIAYYATMAPYLLPYLADRPVNFHRFPDGLARQGFWHKEVPGHAPQWLTRWDHPDPEPGTTQTYPILDSTPALVWAANFAALELHPWTSTAADPHQPSWALIDIDPGESTGFADVLVLARLYRAALEHLRVAGMPKVTGQRGVQIWIPVRDGYTFDQTRDWVHGLSRAVGATVPELISWEWERGKRKGLARLDYTQNAINRTLVAPFSLRPRPGAPVSVPITWDELDDDDLAPDGWTAHTVIDRVQQVGDPLAPLIGYQQDLPKL